MSAEVESMPYRWAETLEPELLKSPWWIGHIPFAFELIGRLRPRVVVELGTYSGSSFAAFCQAMQACGVEGTCHGVDLWEGDIHMGKFDETLYREISEYVARRYPGIARLVRKDFTEAASGFEDGSIDLLHIDGTHTFEAVAKDFATWLPKLSRRGVVLFHDVNVNVHNTGPSAQKFGVRRFFDSVKDSYPHLEFLHCWGLGMLVVGPDAPPAVMELVEASKHPGFAAYFAEKGDAVSRRFDAMEVAPATHSPYGRPVVQETSAQPTNYAALARVGAPRRPLARKRVKLLAFYFPQFHRIAENDQWWGEGFTDWVNVRKAQPMFPGHYQPRVPQEGRYYDQSSKETLAWQIDTAKRYGVHGFCHYHYWFDGKQLLETPTNLVMQNRDLDLPFCLAWANETWSRRWDGRDHHILQEQTHRPDKAMWERHFEYLFRAWSDDRAIKVDGKPMFLIYRAHRVEQIGAMFDFWRELAHRRGLPGIHFGAIKQYEFPVPEVLKHFDSVVQFQPFEALYSPDFPAPTIETSFAVKVARRLLPDKVQDMLRAVRYNLRPRLTFYDYEAVWQQIMKVEREAGIAAFPGAFVDWDNTARYGKRARLFYGASPERFEYWFRQLVQHTASRPAPEHFIFMNAWNEWAEGTYLEPDERHGYRYLEAVRECLATSPDEDAVVTTAARSKELKAAIGD